MENNITVVEPVSNLTISCVNPLNLRLIVQTLIIIHSIYKNTLHYSISREKQVECDL